MFKFFLTASLVFCVFVFAFELTADEVEYNEATTTVLDVFPKEIKIGDTLYCVIKATNNTDAATHRLGVIDERAYRGGLFSYIGLDEVKSFVFDGDKKWEIYPYIERFAAHVDFGGSNNILVAPRSSVLLFAYDIRIVSLEDLYEPFWLDVQKNLSQQGKELEFRVEFQPYLQREPCILKEKIKVLPREKNEMKLLEDWYRNTGHMFPELNLDDGYNKNKSKKWLRKKSYKYHYNEINRMFVRLRNLYPCYPNVPDDWQGWKAIEESFKPSTLRDEIRWTRICIQYCATEDEKILEELKSWLKEMNPIQRAVMTNYLPEGLSIDNKKHHPAAVKLYNTIQQFKVVKKD